MDLPPYTTFFSGQMDNFWSIIKYLLFYISPAIMIYVAFKLVEILAPQFLDAIFPNRNRHRRFDEDDDYDDDY